MLEIPEQFYGNLQILNGLISLSRSGKAFRLSRDHKPEDADESKRITDLGGFVSASRVNGILAVSRALGDHVFKPFVAHKPFCRTTRLEEGDLFMILACDGVGFNTCPFELTGLVVGSMFRSRSSQLRTGEPG
jgi:protein phosphatase PTC1